MFKKLVWLVMLSLVVGMGCGVPQTDLPLPKNIDRVVSLAPSLTEIIFLLSSESKLMAVTNDCNFPQATALNKIPKTGPFGTPQIEKIIAAQPQLVLYTDLSDLSIVDKLNQLKIPTRRISINSVLELNAAIADLGQLLGQKDLSWKIIQANQQKVVELGRGASDLPKTTVFVELWDSPLLSAGPQSFIHEIVTLAGGVNVIKKTISPHPQVELESLLQANPDVILKLHNRPSVVTRFPSLKTLRANQQNHIFTPKNMDMYLRPGPRIFLAAEDFQKNLKSLTPRKP